MHNLETLIQGLPGLWHGAQHRIRKRLRDTAKSLPVYLELARVNKPAGVLAIYPPYLLGALVAGVRSSSKNGYPNLVFHAAVLFSAFILRSAGCAWNDVVDREIDRKVARSRFRPLARGAISPQGGTVFFTMLVLAWLGAVRLIRERAVPLAVANIPLVILYPYAKRFTDYPQAVLGLTLSWGVCTGYVMAGTNNVPFWSEAHELHLALLALSAAWIIFTLFYDTIYAYQDIEYDRSAGVRSMAVKVGEKGKYALSVAAVCQTVLMLIVGRDLRWGPSYEAGCLFTAACQLYVVKRVDLHESRSCASWFKKSLLVISALMAISITLARPD